MQCVMDLLMFCKILQSLQTYGNAKICSRKTASTKARCYCLVCQDDSLRLHSPVHPAHCFMHITLIEPISQLNVSQASLSLGEKEHWKHLDLCFYLFIVWRMDIFTLPALSNQTNDMTKLMTISLPWFKAKCISLPVQLYLCSDLQSLSLLI